MRAALLDIPANRSGVSIAEVILPETARGFKDQCSGTAMDTQYSTQDN
jgi:hypothetical protein